MTLAVNIAQGGSNNVTFRNRIINGGMVIDQRNAGASVSISSNTYTLDRYRSLASGGGVYSVQQSSTAPTGFSNSMVMTVTTTAGSPASGNYYALRQSIEGYNIADLNQGSASASTFTISFWVRSSVTGTFGGSVDNDVDRSYPFTFSISSANTWEQKSVTITGCTDGTWNKTNGIGINLQIALGTGSGKAGTAGAWSSTIYFSATGATNLMATNGATFYVTGVQLEAGTTASPFEYRSFGQELVLCQRYYSKSCAQLTVPGSNMGTINAWQGMNGTDGNQIQGPKWPVTMRATPTGYVWSLSGTASSLSTTGETNANINNGSWNVYSPGDTGARAIVGSGGLSSGNAYLYHWAASAEL